MTCGIQPFAALSLGQGIHQQPPNAYANVVAWVNLIKEEFQQWKINPEVGQIIMDFNTPKKTSYFKTPSTGSSLMSNESYHKLMACKKAAKRDISAFEILKDEKYYDAFHRSFKATAMIQGLSDVCDPNFKPKITGFYQKSKILCLVVTYNVVYKNILHINLYILYIIHIKTSSRIQELSKYIKYIKRYKQNNFNYFVRLVFY